MDGFALNLLSGAAAGFAVDCTLYPIDTVKTRLQSAAGFRRAGGFSRLYAGLPSVLVGSAPGSALFFSVYEFVKRSTSPSSTLAHVFAASLGEVAACLVRVPTEVIKQRAQALSPARRPYVIARNIIRTQGLGGLYQGYRATILRDVPFAFIEFPLWEELKHRLSIYKNRPVRPYEGALCGSVAGALAAFVTTPLDVAKTRIMLAERVHGVDVPREGAFAILKDVYRERGVRGLFAGCAPRTLWIALGGVFFFGAYEKTHELLQAFVFLPLTQPFHDETKTDTVKASAASVEVASLRVSAGLHYHIGYWLDRLFVLPFAPERPRTFDETKATAKEYTDNLSWRRRRVGVDGDDTK